MPPFAGRASLLRVSGLALLLALPSMTAQAADKTVTACADPPAWTFMALDASGAMVRSNGFFSLEMLEAAMARMGRSVRFLPMPWARCMQQVAAGQVDFALGAYYSDERATRFSYSVPYSKGTPQVFFMRARALRIAQKADLHRYRGCGLIGGSYGHYGLEAKELDLGVNTYEKLVKKLRANRCDYFVEELEVIAGYKHMGTDYLADPALMHSPVPGVSAPAAHLIAGLNTRASAMMPELNIALLELLRSGQAAQLWHKHAGDIPFQIP